MRTETQNGRNENRAPGTVDRWIARRRWLLLGCILLVAVVARVLYFVQLEDSPCILQHRWDQTDMHFFDGWARRIADGDWLSREIPYPIHAWHVEVAEDHFRIHPEQRPAGSDAQAAARTYWGPRYGEERFYQDPLYPYLVAIVYRIAGLDARAFFVVQMALGIGTILLLEGVGRRCFSEVVGVTSAGLGALCGPLLFYELVLLRTTVIAFTGLALVWLAVRALERDNWRRWLAAGVAGGLALWLKAIFLVYVTGVAAWLVIAYRSRWRQLGRAVAAAAVGIVLGFAPVIVRNLAVGAPALETSSAGGLVFILSNAPDAAYWNHYIGFAHVAKILDGAGDRLLPIVSATLRAHEGVGSYLALLGSKLGAIWSWFEMPNNANFYYYRLHSNVLRFLPVTFFVLAPLSLVGLVLALPRAARAAPLYLLVLTHLAALLAFYVNSRYRLPLLVALIPFAACTLARIGGWIARRRWLAAAATLAAVVAAGAWTGRPIPEREPLIRFVDHSTAVRLHFRPLAREAERAGEWDRASVIWTRALRFEPESVREMSLQRAPRDEQEAALAGLYAGVHFWRSEALRKAGRTEEADRERARAQTLLDLFKAAVAVREREATGQAP